MRRLLFILLLIAAPPLLALLALAALRTGPPPVLTVAPGGPSIGKHTPVQVSVRAGGRGLSELKVELRQGDRSYVLAEKSYRPRRAWEFWGPRTPEDAVTLQAGTDTVRDLKAGEAVLSVTATRAGTWLRHPEPVVEERKLPVRLTPPAVYLTSSQHYVAQGGAEVVVYRVGETAVRDGVRSGDEWFPGFPLPGGQAQDRFAIFAVPHDLSDPSRIRLVAADDAGNESAAAFVDQFFQKPFKTDTLTVDDTFIARVVPEILSHTPDIPDRGDPLQNYLAVNRDVRKANAQSLKALAAKSAPRFLWTEPFLPMPGGKVMAAFADRRTYTYGGREVDRQDHLGFDLATTEQSPVPAGNSGLVVMAGYLGIYGNAVVIDHGYGVMSLYGHLSSIDVQEGQQVQRGQILGRTGHTGLAGGDHLHFTVLVHGVPVNPSEWWDPHWIRDRLARKLGPALPFAATAHTS
jgi:murein DD-endopeptidase MepM/ murein hydrolase activator NlpD